MFRLINNMIAMTDDDWQHAKLAIGLFGAEGARDKDGVVTDQYWGVNADVIGGKLLVGHNLIIENKNDMGVMQFKVDAGGAFLNNGVLCIQTDTKDKGKLMIDPRYGIAAGNQNLYALGADGTSLVPSFVDGTGVSLDNDGMPENAMFYLDIRNGKAYFRGDVYAENGYFRGTVYATDGEFKGIVKATDFQTPAGVSMLKNGKFDSKYLDLGNITLDGTTGDITMTGNITMGGNINLSTGSITWGNNAPVKYQFGTSLTGPWHSTMAANDKYRRDSLDGGTTWGEPYQFRGSDGKNGSDARVPEYIHETYISSTEIISPTIKANEYKILPLSPEDKQGSFVIRGNVGGNLQYDMFRIDYSGSGDYPSTRLYASSGTHLTIGSSTGHTHIEGDLDLSKANITDWGNNAPTAVFG